MPETAPVTPVTDDIFQVRLPLPFALNSVNVYLLRGKNGWTVLDTGLNTPLAQAAWAAAFDALHITPADIQQIVLTHVHPDHYGMAGWLQAHGAGVVRLSTREAELARLLWQGEGEQSRGFDRYLIHWGMPAPMAGEVAHGIFTTGEMTFPHPTQVETLTAGGTIQMGARHFLMIHAPGHSDGQLMFYDAADKLILCGDHVLMKITPNIGLWPDTEPDPLGRFLASLTSLQTLDVRLALPGHKTLITNWPGRVNELLQHHAARLEQAYQAVLSSATVYEASRKIFNSDHFSTHEWRFAMVETLAHLEYLRLAGRVQRQEEDTLRFRAIW